MFYSKFSDIFTYTRSHVCLFFKLRERRRLPGVEIDCDAALLLVASLISERIVLPRSSHQSSVQDVSEGK